MKTLIRTLLIYLGPILIALAIHFIIETGIHPRLLALFLLASLIALIAESALANLTKGEGFTGTLRKTCRKVVQDQNGPQLLILSVKYAALTTAGLILTAIVAGLSN